LKVAAGARLCDNIGKALLDRTIADLIIGLDMAADHIPPDDLGGANEAHVGINSVDELRGFLHELREVA
jgi:hypothetical protein